MADTGGKNSVSGVEVEYLLKSQESHMKTFIENIDKRYEERMTNQSKSFDHEIYKLHDVAKERHQLFEKHESETKASLELQVTELRTLLRS